MVASPFGRGNAILCLENPYQADEPGARLGLTDNLPLSKYLVENFVKKFGLFRPAHAALDRVTWLENAEFYTTAHDKSGLTEGGRVGDRSLSLTWVGLQSPFMVDVPPAKSQTGEHVMFSVFQAASAGSIAVDGRNIEGSTVERFLRKHGAIGGIGAQRNVAEAGVIK